MARYLREMPGASNNASFLLPEIMDMVDTHSDALENIGDPATITDIQTRLAALESSPHYDAETIEATVAQLVTDIETIVPQVEQNLADIQNQETIVADLLNRITSLETAVPLLDTRVANNLTSINDLTNTLVATDQFAGQLDTRLTTVEAEQDQQRTELDDHEVRLTAAETKVTALEDFVQKYQDRSVAYYKTPDPSVQNLSTIVQRINYSESLQDPENLVTPGVNWQLVVDTDDRYLAQSIIDIASTAGTTGSNTGAAKISTAQLPNVGNSGVIAIPAPETNPYWESSGSYWRCTEAGDYNIIFRATIRVTGSNTGAQSILWKRNANGGSAYLDQNYSWVNTTRSQMHTLIAYDTPCVVGDRIAFRMNVNWTGTTTPSQLKLRAWKAGTSTSSIQLASHNIIRDRGGVLTSFPSSAILDLLAGDILYSTASLSSGSAGLNPSSRFLLAKV